MRLLYLKSLQVILLSSLESTIKNILITTVSAYLSQNSGVAFRNSRPGCVSSKFLKRGLKSSGYKYLLSFYASKINNLRSLLFPSNSLLKYEITWSLLILSPSIFSFRFISSNKRCLNIFGNLQQSTQTGSNSCRLNLEDDRNILSMHSYYAFSSS